jgi:hypothetical protein
MSHNFLQNASFHLLLSLIDKDLSAKAQEAGCHYCGGPLHQADYPRSPCGISAPFRGYYDKRLSYCCGTCRKRNTAPSVRFFGRRRFPMPFLLLISALQSGINDWRREQIKRHMGISISDSTWKRWRRWWREVFPGTLFWRGAQGHCVLFHGPHPRALLSLFKGNIEQKIIHVLKFLTPITAGILRAV